MIVGLGLPLNIATITLGSIFSVVFSDYGGCSPISIPKPPIVALTEFSMQMQWLASIHCQYPDISYPPYECTCVLVCIFCLCYDLSPRRLAPRVVLTFNVTICTVRLHFSHFCFSLSSVADFSNTWARAPTSAVGLSMGHGNLLMAVFIPIYRNYLYWGAAVVSRSNYLIMAVEPYD